MNKLIALVLVCGFGLSTHAQGDFHYRRSIKEVSDTWHRLIIPDEVYGRLNKRFSDLRILGLTDDGDTIEIPYILKAAREIAKVSNIDVDDFNRVERNGRYYYSFKTNSEELINFMHLEFDRLNFSWDIQLEGSQDQQNWYTVLKNYHILSIREEHANYSFTDLHFLATSFRYYRISIPSETDPQFRKITVRHHELDPGVIHSYAPKNVSIKQKGKQTIVDLELPNAVPIDWLHVFVTANYDYYRPCAVYYVEGDSLASVEGHREYQLAGNGVINSVVLSGIEMNPSVAKHWRLIIENFDDEALPIQSVQFYGPVYQLFARFIGKAKFYLFYGDEQASAPHYDLEHFAHLIPEDAKLVDLGKEERLKNSSEAEQNSEATFQSPWWLWGMIGLVILLLGTFTLRMLKHPNTEG